MRARPLSRTLVFLVLVVCGVLMVASAQTAQGTQLRGEAQSLSDLVREHNATGEELEDEVARLRDDVEGLSARLSRGDQDADAARTQAQNREAGAGLTPVAGTGVTVVLDDALSQGSRPSGVSADDLIVHQQDVQGVINALWAGGAEAVAINDQRLVSTSAVRCVGNTLRVNSRVYSPPYSISAVGDPQALQHALDASPEIAAYMAYVDRLGLGWELMHHESLELPAYTGSLDFRYAEVGS
ncbi:DUF881 domain-containing protein [Sediminivirga luteola]|uniref:DUF881 domain-containing protein n=1 Tax=Sediminivirga luteola TaxID=1774748 RepID=UPI001F5AE51C|nr:DUF881 domain-containing protein [Sediminivirga luteola]MCI2267104.1 DUF881 domain-containing protein [Sediminivirga luteola]